MAPSRLSGRSQRQGRWVEVLLVNDIALQSKGVAGRRMIDVVAGQCRLAKAAAEREPCRRRQQCTSGSAPKIRWQGSRQGLGDGNYTAPATLS